MLQALCTALVFFGIAFVVFMAFWPNLHRRHKSRKLKSVSLTLTQEVIACRSV